MCEDCLRRYNDELNHAELAKMEDLIPELMALGDKLAAVMSSQMVGAKVLLDNGQVVDLADAPEETKKEIMPQQEAYHRIEALSYATAFMAYRYSLAPQMDVMMSSVISGSANEGAQIGHIVKEALAMRRN